MAGTVYSVQNYTGRTAVTDATAFIEALGADAFVEVECWAEAENTRIMIVYKTGQQ
jgi:hypothetical protein